MKEFFGIKHRYLKLKIQNYVEEGMEDCRSQDHQENTESPKQNHLSRAQQGLTETQVIVRDPIWV